MHTISRIFATSLLAITIYAQSEPEPCLNDSRAPFEKILRGTSSNISSDTLHWDNVHYFNDIIPIRCDTRERKIQLIAILALLAEAYIFYNIIEYSRN